MASQEQDTAMFDQPWDDGGMDHAEEVAQAIANPPKRSRKAQRHVDHMKTMQYEVTPAQRLMQAEMEESIRRREELDVEWQPVSLAVAFGQLIGPVSQADPQVQAQAREIINAAPNLQLSLAQWQIVQGMVEAGIMLGADEGFRLASG